MIPMVKIISWNLLRLVGASLGDVARLVQSHKPDLLLMQEATAEMDGLPDLFGGHYHRTALPGRVHGLAAWSPETLPGPATVLPLPSGELGRVGYSCAGICSRAKRELPQVTCTLLPSAVTSTSTRGATSTARSS